MPGGEVLFFTRMSEPAPAAVVSALHRCLNPSNAEFASNRMDQHLAGIATRDR